MVGEKYLRYDEKVIYNLRTLYGAYGYLPFRMSKFEEYDLYVKNKDFLVSDSVITFNDTNGKLLALKPDVTLSIIKNGQDEKGGKQKVFYSENVYRISGSTRQFKEIMQTGLECIGDIDLYDMFEVISLACASLKTISNDYVVEISHLGILNALLSSASEGEAFKSEIMECFKQKNGHEIKKICEKHQISKEKEQLLCDFVSVYGSADKVIDKLSSFNVSASFTSSINELKELLALIDKTEYKDKIRLDFSIVNDMNYYNGIVFNGFINGVCETVLFGGRYDNLLNKMERSSKGIGFAVYVDLLDGLCNETREYDVDALIIYDENTDTQKLIDTVNSYVSRGQSVTTQKCIPTKMRYRELINIAGEDVK